MRLYFAANESQSNNKKTVRIELNLTWTAQTWFDNIIKIPLNHYILESMEYEIIGFFKLSN